MKILLFVATLFLTPWLGEAARQIVGGWSHADVESSIIQEKAAFAHDDMARSSNSMFATRRGPILKAKKQVVSGMKYNITMLVYTTSCRVASHGGPSTVSEENCPATETQKCNVVVWSQEWMPTPNKLLNFQCRKVKGQNSPGSRTHNRSKRQIGGQRNLDATDDHVQTVAQFATSELHTGGAGQYAVSLNDVKDATSQVVAGVMYRVNISVHLTSCHDRHKLLNDCKKSDTVKESIICCVTVWDQAWRTPRYTLEHHQCRAMPDNTLYLFVPNIHDTPKSLIGAGGHDGGRVMDTRPKIGTGYSDFQQFMAKFGRMYESAAEEARRYKIFRQNMKQAQFIQDHDLGTATYGATMFADLTREEFSKYISGTWNKRTDPRMKVAEIPQVTPPPEFDWRDHDAVTPVKNQGSCGSCWAFSVTGNIEGQWALKKKSLVSISEQELVDCDKLDEGCNGGLPSNAYSEIQRLGGLETEGDYPYKGEDEKCVFSPDKVKVYINGSLNISSNEVDMAAWLYQNGPMSIGINAFAMQFYFGGISHPWKIFCPDALDHGVLIVGYGVKKGIIYGETPYWIVKNSWGSSWGEKGYYLVYRGDGTCGLNEMVSSALIN